MNVSDPLAGFSIHSIRTAAERIAGQVNRTPLLESPQLNARVGGRVLVKAESLQPTGAFKLRGALNAVLTLTDAQRRAGVVTYSAGNHGQGLAAAARQVGTTAVVVMPTTAPRTKVERCQWWGAEVLQYDPATEDRAEIAADLVARRGLTFVPPFDHVDVMSGQGTVGLEIAEQLHERDIEPDAVLVNCSGGGLAAGVFEAISHAYPGTALSIVEAAALSKWSESLRSGVPARLAAVPPTVLDGIAGPAVGALCLAAIRRHQPDVIEIDDETGLRGVRAAFETLRIVLEPAGAASLGALLDGSADGRGRTTVVIASGGNVDPAVFTRALDTPIDAEPRHALASTGSR